MAYLPYDGKLEHGGEHRSQLLCRFQEIMKDEQRNAAASRPCNYNVFYHLFLVYYNRK